MLSENMEALRRGRDHPDIHVLRSIDDVHVVLFAKPVGFEGQVKGGLAIEISLGPDFKERGSYSKA